MALNTDRLVNHIYYVNGDCVFNVIMFVHSKPFNFTYGQWGAFVQISNIILVYEDC